VLEEYSNTNNYIDFQSYDTGDGSIGSRRNS